MAQETFTGSNNQEFFTTIDDAIKKLRELDSVTQKSKNDINDYAKSFNGLTKELKAFAKASVGGSNKRGSRNTRPSSSSGSAQDKIDRSIQQNSKTAVQAFTNVFKAVAGNTKDLTSYVNIMSKGGKATSTAVKGTQALSTALGVVSTTGATVVGVLGLIVTALVAMTVAGKKAYERNMDLNRSLMQMGAGADEMKNASAEIANKSKEVENKWSLIGQKLSNVFQPVYEFFLDIADKFTDLIASITGANKVGLNSTNLGTRVSWYTGMLQEQYSEPETKSIPTINSIAGSARQSGFDLSSAVNLAIGTYDAAYKLGQKFGLQAQDIAKQLSDAWLTGSDAAKEYGVVVNDTVLSGYMASKGVDIVNVQITDAMKQYYRYQLMLEETNAKSQDAIQQQIKSWTQLGMQIEATKQKLFSFDEVINLQGLDTAIPIVGKPSVGPYGTTNGNDNGGGIPPIVIPPEIKFPDSINVEPNPLPVDLPVPIPVENPVVDWGLVPGLVIDWGTIPDLSINWGLVPDLGIVWDPIPDLTINWGLVPELLRQWSESWNSVPQWVTQWNFGWDVGTILLKKWMESWQLGYDFNTVLNNVFGQAKQWQAQGLTYYAAVTASLAKIFETFNNIVSSIVNKFIEIKEKFTSVGEKIKNFGNNLGVAFKYSDELQRAAISEATGGNLRIGDVLAKAVEESSKGKITKEEYIDAWNQSVATGKLGEIKQGIDAVGNWFDHEAPINLQNLDEVGRAVGIGCASALAGIGLGAAAPAVGKAAAGVGTAAAGISAASPAFAAEVNVKVKNKQELDKLTKDLDTIDKKETVADVSADTKAASTDITGVSNKLAVLTRPKVVTIAANDRISSVINNIQTRLNSLMSFSYTPSAYTHNTPTLANNSNWLNNSAFTNGLFGGGRHFASGGIGTHEINNATLFEGNKPEAVIPLQTDAGVEYLASALREAQSGGEGGGSVTINLSLNGIFDTDDRGKWERLAEKLAETIQIQQHRYGGLGYGAQY